MRQARAAVKIPIHVMIRPRPGDFPYTAPEIAAMRASIQDARANGMDGIVLGVLKSDSTVNIEVTKQLIESATPLLATFHRAFDCCPDLPQALEDCIRTGARRILTSGGASSAELGLQTLKALIEASRLRIIIMPGGGIHGGNLRELRRATRATEFHSGLGSVFPYGSAPTAQFEVQVRELVASLN
jgi:copper homeostasis protein